MHKEASITNTAQILNGKRGLFTTQGLGDKMPYKVVKGKDGYQVFKLDDSGKTTGKALGTHSNRAKAVEQMKALYANEKGSTKKELPDLSQLKEGENVTLGTGTYALSSTIDIDKGYSITGVVSDNMLEKDYYEDEAPASPFITSFADLLAQRDAQEMAQVLEGLTDDFGMLAYNISCNPMIEDKAGALAKLAQEYQEMMTTYTAHETNEETVGEEIEDHFIEDEDYKELSALEKAVNWVKAKITNQGSLPDSAFLYIEPGGKKEGGKTTPNSLRHLPVPDKAHIRNAISRLSQPATGKTDGEKWLTEDLRKKLLAKARKMLGEDEKKELFIWKEDGVYRWIAAYSNNRLDDEQEIISNVSHKEFDEALHKKEWPMPEVYLWHIPYPVGATDYHAYDESAGFPVAAGHFYKGMEWAAEGIIEKNWSGNSHGMPESWVKYDPNNPSVIIRHRTKEITFLPLWAAANKLTFNIINKETNMSELEKGLPAHKRPEFVDAFGEERVKQIEAALADKAKEADEAGVVKKEETPAQGVTHAEIAEVLKEIKGMFTSFNSRLDALEKSVVKEEDKYDLISILKSKSVIGSDTARIDGRSILAKDAPVETPNPQAAGQHPVGLINNLFAANENWASGRVR